MPLVTIFVIILLLNWIYRKRLGSVYPGIAISLFIALCGYSASNIQRQSLYYIYPGQHEIVVQINDYPVGREVTTRVPARIISIDGYEIHKKTGNIMLYLYNNRYKEDLLPGYRVMVLCEPAEIKNFTGTSDFDYKRYMNRRGFRYMSFPDSCSVISRQTNNIKAKALIIRKKLGDIYSEAGLEGENLALISALTLGYRELVTEEMAESFSRAGIMHILAVSGLHVGILSHIVIFLLSFLKGRFRLVKMAVVISSIWFFALITGLSPSVVRAATMFSFLHAGRFLNRPVNSINSVLASAFIMMLMNPSIIFEVGFQLSYSAVLFILLYYREMSSLLHLRSLLLKRIWELSVVTILAQLGTLPFVLFYFQRMPLLSIPANIVSIPVTFMVLSCGFLLLFTYLIPYATIIFVPVLKFLLQTLMVTATDISTLPFSSINTPPPGIPALITILVTLPVVTSFILKEKKPHPHLVYSAFIICALSF